MTVAFGNGEMIPRRDVPRVTFDELRESIFEAAARGARLGALFANEEGSGPGTFALYAVLLDPGTSSIAVTSCAVGRDGFPTLARDWPATQLFERAIAEQHGIVPRGHPCLKPVRFHATWPDRRGSPSEAAAHGPPRSPFTEHTGAPPQIGVMDFHRVEGEAVHEVAVGPVHAGVIEPGHFRFQCHGERVFHLEISLGYQHRGLERRLIGGPDKRTVHYLETAAGDSTIAHATAYAQVVEGLASLWSPSRADALRGVALELERLANHTGDLGALAGDVAFLPTASWCGRLRGDWLNLTAALCGNRFGRDFVRPGGTRFDVDASLIATMLDRVAAARADLESAVHLLWDTPSAMARFDRTGALTKETAREIGLVGPAARACGLTRDVRTDFPAGPWRFAHVPPSTWDSGDVFARAYVRWLECEQSMRFVAEQLRSLPEGPVGPEAVVVPFAGRPPPAALAPDALAVAVVEGWRGEVCHVALTDARGRFERYSVVDPSFHNWFGLALALRGQEISDFPLCNKSFNLSYCGHDL